MFGKAKSRVVQTPVLVIDALGFSQKIANSGPHELLSLGGRLEEQYHRFRAKIPFRAMAVFRKWVLGTPEFSTFQLNDMFVLFSERNSNDAISRYLVASVLLYQVLVVEGFVPRGGLGFGDVLRGDGYIIGRGFIDAYHGAEKREDRHRNICAIQITPTLLARMPNTPHAHRLLCYYQNAFFIHPLALVDPDIAQLDRQKLLEHLAAAGTNAEKLGATEHFLQNLEDYDRAAQLDSRTWEDIRRAHGAG